jgi:hypothetical protein
VLLPKQASTEPLKRKPDAALQLHSLVGMRASEEPGGSATQAPETKANIANRPAKATMTATFFTCFYPS